MNNIKIAKENQGRRLTQLGLILCLIGFFASVFCIYYYGFLLHGGWYEIWDGITASLAFAFGMYLFGTRLSKTPSKILGRILSDTRKIHLFLCMSILGFFVSILFMYLRLTFLSPVWMDLFSDMINVGLFGFFIYNLGARTFSAR